MASIFQCRGLTWATYILCQEISCITKAIACHHTLHANHRLRKHTLINYIENMYYNITVWILAGNGIHFPMQRTYLGYIYPVSRNLVHNEGNRVSPYSPCQSPTPFIGNFSNISTLNYVIMGVARQTALVSSTIFASEMENTNIHEVKLKMSCYNRD